MSELTSRERFLAACRCEPLERPPVWVMRQAGRYLPEYRKLKESYTFHQLVQTPELALEVTMQPLARFDLDAAILFSDILVIPEALGQPYHFRETGGIEMEFAVRDAAQIEALEVGDIRDKLGYVAEAIGLIKAELAESRALIGFGGSPWTLATYMIEGASSKDYRHSRELFYTQRPVFDALMEKITTALVDYFRMQIAAGVDVIQIFDSWGGVLAPQAFVEASTSWITRIVSAIGDEVPVIVFSKQMHDHSEALVATGANVLGVSWTADLARVRRGLPDRVGVQGNLDPVLMNTTPDLVAREASRILESMRPHDGFIFNLGHGITPYAKVECMEALIATVTQFR